MADPVIRLEMEFGREATADSFLDSSEGLDEATLYEAARTVFLDSTTLDDLKEAAMGALDDMIMKEYERITGQEVVG